MYGLILFFHLLGACVWTGGHLVLATTVLPRALRERSIAELQRFEAGYEKIGIPALAIQLATGLWLAYRLVPMPSRWLAFDNPVVSLIGFKLCVLVATVVLAVDARLRIIPKLTEDRLVSLAWHIIPVTLLSVLYVLIGVSFRSGWF